MISTRGEDGTDIIDASQQYGYLPGIIIDHKQGGGDDIRCKIEARVEGHQPNVVSHDAANVKQALTGAEDKLIRQLNKIIERQRNH